MFTTGIITYKNNFSSNFILYYIIVYWSGKIIPTKVWNTSLKVKVNIGLWTATYNFIMGIRIHTLGTTKLDCESTRSTNHLNLL